MASHVILAHPGNSLPDDRSVVIRDGFSWPAFWTSLVWLLVHRLWLQAAMVIVVLAVVVWSQTDPDWIAAGLCLLLCVTMLTGLEAQNWRINALLRRGWRLVDVVEAPDAETAFDMHVAGWTVVAPSRSGPGSMAPMRPSASIQPAAIGLVPWQRG